MSTIETAANLRVPSRGGRPQLPTESQTACTGCRVDSRMRLLAMALPRSTTQERPTPTATPTSPTSTATHQSENVKPVISRQIVATSGIRRPAITNEGTPISRERMISTSELASKRAGRRSLSSVEFEGASISRSQ